jgi:predicted phosphate transport protein (TIGR00153 family)
MAIWKKLKDALTGASVEGTVRDLGMASEQRTLDQILEMVDLVVTICERLVDVVKFYCADACEAMSKVAGELDQLESKADTMKRDILAGLSSGGFFPISRADLFRLVIGLDRIANFATGAADRIGMRRFDLPVEVKHLLEEMAETDLRAVRKLREAILMMRPNMREAENLADEVDRIEGEVDDIYVKIYSILFEMDTDFKTFHQLKAIIERLEEVADRAADCAETIRLIAVRHLEIQ